MSEPIDLDLIEARAKALGWQSVLSRFAFGRSLRVETPSGLARYVDIEGVTRYSPMSPDDNPSPHDLAALESPEPARPVVDPVAELLPCPFCGGKAEPGLSIVVDCEVGITCAGCGASVTDHDGDEGKAMAAWNRRTP